MQDTFETTSAALVSENGSPSAPLEFPPAPEIPPQSNNGTSSRIKRETSALDGMSFEQQQLAILSHPLLPFVLRAINDVNGELNDYVPDDNVWKDIPEGKKEVTDFLLQYLHLIELQNNAAKQLQQQAIQYCNKAAEERIQAASMVDDASDGSNSPGDLELALDQDVQHSTFRNQQGYPPSAVTLKRQRDDSAMEPYRKSLKSSAMRSPEMKVMQDTVKQEYDANPAASDPMIPSSSGFTMPPPPPAMGNNPHIMQAPPVVSSHPPVYAMQSQPSTQSGKGRSRSGSTGHPSGLPPPMQGRVGGPMQYVPQHFVQPTYISHGGRVIANPQGGPPIAIREGYRGQPPPQGVSAVSMIQPRIYGAEVVGGNTLDPQQRIYAYTPYPNPEMRHQPHPQQHFVPPQQHLVRGHPSQGGRMVPVQYFAQRGYTPQQLQAMQHVQAHPSRMSHQMPVQTQGAQGASGHHRMGQAGSQSVQGQRPGQAQSQASAVAQQQRNMMHVKPQNSIPPPPGRGQHPSQGIPPNQMSSQGPSIHHSLHQQVPRPQSQQQQPPQQVLPGPNAHE